MLTQYVGKGLNVLKARYTFAYGKGLNVRKAHAVNAEAVMAKLAAKPVDAGVVARHGELS